MKKQLLLGCALSALLAVSPAFAKKKEPPPQPPTPPAPVFIWTGWYVGGNVGYSWGRGTPTFNDPALSTVGLPTSFSGPGNLNGAIGGIQIGYDWQANTNWVWGFETDFQWADEKNSGAFAAPYDCEGICSISGTIGSRIHWFGTVRGRAGWLYNPTTMVFVTGGFAYGKVSINGSLTNFNNGGCCNGSPPGPPPGTFTFGSSAVNTGWTVGGGVRGVVPNAPAWVWKIEYLYIDLGSLNGNGVDPIFGGVTSWSAHFTDNILRFGLDFHFH
jgi:outer membrane immunogenic protein